LQAVGGKILFGALYGVYTLPLMELKTVLQHRVVKKGPTSAHNTISTSITTTNIITTATVTSAPDKGDFREQKRRKRANSGIKRPGSVKKQGAITNTE
jgi:hypothetical protein